MGTTLADEINAALERCNRGGASHKLPGDFDLTPILEVDDAGRCTGVKCWRARIDHHVADGATPHFAVRGLCPDSVGP